MTDRNFVRKWAHLGLGKNPKYRQLMAQDQLAFIAHVEEIWVEQVEKNAALRGRVSTNVLPLRIADRYAAGRKHG